MNLAKPHFQKPQHFIHAFGLLIILASCMVCYINGLFGGFLFDDYSNIVNNNLLQPVDGNAYHWWWAALSSNSGILRRPVSMLSFAANIYWFGMNPIAFKIVNVIIHLLNGALVYRLGLWLSPYLRPSRTASKSETQDKTIALVVAALWLLHPLSVSNVVYIVQRMNLLATLFTLAGLCCYVEGRRRILREGSGLLVAFSGLLLFGLLSTLSKENGALIVLYAFVIEAVCFRFRGAGFELQKPVVAFFLLTLVLPLVLFVGYMLVHPEWLTNGYGIRDFTLSQRLLTEPRILWNYMQWIFIPLPSSMGLYHDDIPLSTGLLSPITTALGIAAWLALAAVAWKLRHRIPALTFGFAWFLAGHVMESTFLPLEIVFEHRNYLPMAGLLLGTTVATAQVLGNWSPTIISVICLTTIVVLAGLTAGRARDWGDPTRLALVTAKDHPNSPRSLYDAGRATFLAAEAAGKQDVETREQALRYFERAIALDKTYVFPATSIMLVGFRGKVVPESAIADLAYRLRNMPLFQATPVLMLLTKIGDGAVLVTPEDVDRLVTAALENPNASQEAKAMVLNNYGRYQFTILHDAQSAVSLTLSAAEMAPGNPFFQINLANLALALKQPAIAKKHVDLAERLDTVGQYKIDIGSINMNIDKQLNEE